MQFDFRNLYFSSGFVDRIDPKACDVPARQPGSQIFRRNGDRMLFTVADERRNEPFAFF